MIKQPQRDAANTWEGVSPPLCDITKWCSPELYVSARTFWKSGSEQKKWKYRLFWFLGSSLNTCWFVCNMGPLKTGSNLRTLPPASQWRHQKDSAFQKWIRRRRFLCLQAIVQQTAASKCTFNQSVASRVVFQMAKLAWQVKLVEAF